MRLGQRVLWDSLAPESRRIHAGIVRCYEYDVTGKAIVEAEPDGAWIPIARNRLRVVQPPAKFSAKGGGDSPTSSAALIAEVA